MRLRNVPGARERMVESEFVINDAKQWKGRWKEVFHNEHDIHIEIGMGKGKFLMQLAKENPDINFIGIEKYSSVLLRALEKQEEMLYPNLFFIRMDAENIGDVFEKVEVKRIYLNFSDPWPKDRHAKRRLTSKEFFSRYDSVLEKKGRVIFKTDNRLLFDFSLEQAAIAGWKLEDVTYDLHHGGCLEGNVRCV